MRERRQRSKQFDVVPPEIIAAWAKGEYQVGDIPSLSYTQLGTALFLRSWYTYENAQAGAKSLAGIAKIDIKGPFLVMGGIRLSNDGKPCATFWASEASHFVSENEILWFYMIFRDDTPAVRELAEKYGLPGNRYEDSENAGRCGLEPGEWDKLLTHLRTDFDEEIEKLKLRVDRSTIDRGMLAFNPKPDGDRFLCLYHQRYLDPLKGTDLISGATWFTKAFLS
jgi:hypothetical protein